MSQRFLIASDCSTKEMACHVCRLNRDDEVRFIAHKGSLLYRNAARESFQAVKQQEDRGCGSVKGPASEYLHAVMPSYYQSGGGNKAAPLRAAEAALKANSYTCLTSSDSMR